MYINRGIVISLYERSPRVFYTPIKSTIINDILYIIDYSPIINIWKHYGYIYIYIWIWL